MNKNRYICEIEIKKLISQYAKDLSISGSTDFFIFMPFDHYTTLSLCELSIGEIICWEDTHVFR